MKMKVSEHFDGKFFRLDAKGSNYLVATISAKELGFVPDSVLCPIPTRVHEVKPYPVPKVVKIGIRDTEDTGAKFTPSPMAVVVMNDRCKVLVCVGASRGKHLWTFVDFRVKRGGVTVEIDFEGHTPLSRVRKDVKVLILRAAEGEETMELLSRGVKLLYPAAFDKPKRKRPDWWTRPIYCGWGDQVTFSAYNEGVGPESRALAYCIQGLYERWIGRLEQAGLPIGTIIIDAGWSQAGVWKPDTVKWPDLKGFIRNQHNKGRKVLLWIATWLTEGLPDNWCVFAGDRRISADPTNREYRSFLRESVMNLLSSKGQGLDADGFKIDQLAYTPTEYEPRGGERFGKIGFVKGKHPKIKLAGAGWGCELLYMLQKEIYESAVSVKPSALISSSTVHPYFYDTFNMTRLHDTGRVDADIFAGMKARADLALAVLPNNVIDADNWINTDYEKWLDYTMRSYQIGVPCIFYSERFVNSWWDPKVKPLTRPIPLADLKRIARVWKKL